LSTDLAGKVALVTGGSRGIGAAICRRLAEEGSTIAVAYRSGAAEAEAVTAQLGGRSRCSTPDVRRRYVANCTQQWQTWP
jgi:3-oxoacyl-[acyl-carrier protein] reductase